MEKMWQPYCLTPAFAMKLADGVQMSSAALTLRAIGEPWHDPEDAEDYLRSLDRSEVVDSKLVYIVLPIFVATQLA